MRSDRLGLAVVALGFIAASAWGQSARVTVSHDDPDGIVFPGQTVTITLKIAHEGFFMVADWRGDAVASPDLGTAQNPIFGVGPSPGVTYGLPDHGSVRGSVFHAFSPFFTPPPYTPWSTPEFEFLHYLWIAPVTPGQVAFNWMPAPGFPSVQGYLSPISVDPTSYPTTYLGTSLTVIPNPSAALALGVTFFGSAAVRRRR